MKSRYLEEVRRLDAVAKALFLAEHPKAQWQPGRARWIWFARAQAAIEAADKTAAAREVEELRAEVERLREAIDAEDAYWAASREHAAAFGRQRDVTRWVFEAATKRRDEARAALASKGEATDGEVVGNPA